MASTFDIFTDEKVNEICRKGLDNDSEYIHAFETRHKFMRLAFDEAEDALKNLEVPVGCVFVYQDKVIGRGRNEVNVLALCFTESN